MLISYPRQYGKPAGLLQYFKLCKTLPLTGPGGDQLLTPSLQLFLLLKAIYLYTCFIRSVQNMYMLCFARICKDSGKVKVPVQDAQAGRVGSLPPPPLLRWRSRGGGGRRRLASHVLPGDFEQGRGDLWQVNLAGHTRGWIWHVSMARHFGGSVWRVSLAHLFGGFS